MTKRGTAQKTTGSIMTKIRKLSRLIHRDLSFFFSGMLLVYAVSGIALNHKDTFNSQYTVERKTFAIEKEILSTKEDMTKKHVLKLLEPLEETEHYLKHYFPEPDKLKVFLKGGSNLEVCLTDGQAVYESVKRRPVMGALSKLHYNPGKAWTVFADVFAVSLVIIVLSGLVMLKGRHGLNGIGGIELLAGMLIPLLFALL